ncbi:MAG TPA: hypothetical protein VID24_10245 [Candidatus Eremiobacteraceae bacterium]|jgi:hypothetical protein
MVLIREPIPPLTMPSPTAVLSAHGSTRHFTIDDIDLGPSVRLTRFRPDFDIYPGAAIEGADGKLYVAYYPNRPPEQWGFTGGEASRIGILEGGQIKPVALVAHEEKLEQNPGRVELLGLARGKPVVKSTDGGIDRYFMIGPHAVTESAQMPSSISRLWPCIPFDGGQVCDARDSRGYAVQFKIPGRPAQLVTGAIYTIERRTSSGELSRSFVDEGDVWFEGGGPGVFLVTEYHSNQDAAECLVGEVVRR